MYATARNASDDDGLMRSSLYDKADENIKLKTQTPKGDANGQPDRNLWEHMNTTRDGATRPAQSRA